MEIDEKIILCEVAREAINGRFREWLAVQYRAEEENNQQLADYANSRRRMLLDLRMSLRVNNPEVNQRIIEGDFEPQSPNGEYDG